MSVQSCRSMSLSRAVEIGSETTYIISVSAKEKTAADAAATAGMLLPLVISATSAPQPPQAAGFRLSCLQSATSNTETGRAKHNSLIIVYTVC